MVLVTANRRLWFVGMAVSLLIFAVVYFTVVRPSADTANEAVKAGLQQSEQVIKQSEQQLSNAGAAAGASSGAAGSAASAAQTQLHAAAKLAACLASAGTDVNAAEACRAQYGG